MPQKITLISVGKLKNSHLEAAAQPFLKNLRRYTQFKAIETKDARRNRRDGDVRLEEAKLITAALPKAAHVVALDERGTLRKTESLAEWLSLLDRKSVGHLCFLIGGPDGLHPSILESAHESISLSPLTFTHEMARFLLIEQVYRVLSFRAGHPYHRV